MKLERNEVAVWYLDARLPVAPEFTAWLSPDEVARAKRFRFPKDGHEFVRTRLGLRCLLATYLGAHPQEFEFTFSEFGKPRLKDESGLFFNVSHSQGLAVLAFSNLGEVGIDLEYQRELPELTVLAEQSFAPEELMKLSQTEAKLEQQTLFYKIWVRKEAFTKTLGQGLQMNLQEFSVLGSDVISDGTQKRRLSALNTPKGFSGALAAGFDNQNKEMRERFCDLDQLLRSFHSSSGNDFIQSEPFEQWRTRYQTNDE